MKILEFQPDAEYNFKNIGFTYPEDIDIDSLEQLKYHDMRLNQIKETLLTQQNKLQNVLQNFKKIKKSKYIILFVCCFHYYYYYLFHVKKIFF